MSLSYMWYHGEGNSSTSGLYSKLENCICATSYTQTEVTNVITLVANLHSFFRFTRSISGISIPFMDHFASISVCRLTFASLHKSTGSHTYLDYTSSHPASCKHPNPFNSHSGASQMSFSVLKPTFPSTIVTGILNHISPISRKPAVWWSRTKIEFNCYSPSTSPIFTFNTLSFAIFRSLQHDHTTSHVIPFLHFAGISCFWTLWSIIPSPPTTPSSLPPSHATQRSCTIRPFTSV